MIKSVELKPSSKLPPELHQRPHEKFHAWQDRVRKATGHDFQWSRHMHTTKKQKLKRR